MVTTVEIYTDGACLGNPGPGGWAVLLRCGSQEREMSGYYAQTTNNRMELQAALEALSALDRSCVVDLYTDSQYVRQGITQWLLKWQKNNWRTANKQPVKNQDLWQALSEATSRHTINWHWVRGHSGHLGNERVDKLARHAARHRAVQF